MTQVTPGAPQVCPAAWPDRLTGAHQVGPGAMWGASQPAGENAEPVPLRRLRSPGTAGRCPRTTSTPTPTAGTPMTGAYAPDALLTLKEIAALLRRDLSTIKDWNDQGRGKWPNAVQDTDGRRTWRVPVTDLVASGDLDASQIAHVENELAARRESREARVGGPVTPANG